jgi:hypothetical protein
MLNVLYLLVISKTKERENANKSGGSMNKCMNFFIVLATIIFIQQVPRSNTMVAEIILDKNRTIEENIKEVNKFRSTLTQKQYKYEETIWYSGSYVKVFYPK